MSILRIRIYGDPALKKKALPVDKIGPDEKKLFEDMAQTMYAAKGVGLAATQVGRAKQLMVIDIGEGLLKLANPRIAKAQCRRAGEEGCLSFPDITVKIRRPEKVVLEAFNQDGAKVRIDAEGLLARAFGHEIDHLNGVVIIDRAGVRQKLLLTKKLRQIKKFACAANFA